MWKKIFPLMVLSAVLLVGCTNNDTVPKNNETPMEDIRDDARQWKDDVKKDVEGRNFENRNMNENQNNLDMNKNGTNSQVEIIEDVNHTNSVH